MDLKNKIRPVDEVLPLPTLFTLGLQHVLIMYASAITLPILISSALFLTPELTAQLVNATLFVCGMATILQTVGVWIFGVRLPIVMGVTFATIAPIMAVCTSENLAINHVYGATIAAGIIGLLIAPLVSKMVRFFPPVVTGSIITTIGLSVMKVAINWSAGGEHSAYYGNLVNLGVAFSVLAVILLFIRYGSGFIANIAVLLGILFGLGLTFVLSAVPEFSKIVDVPIEDIGQMAWFSFPKPFIFGAPAFDPLVILSFTLIMLVVFIESSGMQLAVGDVVGSPINEKKLSNGLRANALGSIFGGIFNSFLLTSFSQNVGLVVLSGVRSRWVCATSGLILVMLSMFPKAAYLVAAIPPCVIGGAAIVMFGLVFATGVRILSRADLRNSKANLYIIAVSIGLGMIPSLAPNFFVDMPKSLDSFLQSGILITAVSAVLLNIFLRKTDNNQPR